MHFASVIYLHGFSINGNFPQIDYCKHKASEQQTTAAAGN